MIKTYIDGILQEDNILPPADRTKLNNLSGTNTGDETTATILNKIGDGSKISANYLPSYVDDVLVYDNLASFPVTGEDGKIYIAKDSNLTYRWNGLSYTEISPSLALGETSATAYRGDRGKIAYEHSQLTGGTNPHNTTFANIASKPTTVSGYGIIDAVTLTGTETLTNKTINSPTITGTPTGITATHVGLGNVTNNAQVKKIASSTDNAIMRWDGLTGDLPQDSLVTISDTGTINIPTGQSYNINGVALKDVSETLTNKTLTAPVLNTEVTGTGVTTVGEINKLVKTNSSGGITLKGNILVGTTTDDTINKLQVNGSIYSYVPNGNSLTLAHSTNLYDSSSIRFGSNGHYGAYIKSRRVHTSSTGGESDLLFQTSFGGDVLNDALYLTAGGEVQIPSLSGTENRTVVTDSSGKLVKSLAIYSGTTGEVASGGTAFVIPGVSIPGNYTVTISCNRAGYAGVLSYSVIQKLPTYATIYYYAGDGLPATFDWIITY